MPSKTRPFGLDRPLAKVIGFPANLMTMAIVCFVNIADDGASVAGHEESRRDGSSGHQEAEAESFSHSGHVFEGGAQCLKQSGSVNVELTFSVRIPMKGR